MGYVSHFHSVKLSLGENLNQSYSSTFSEGQQIWKQRVNIILPD